MASSAIAARYLMLVVNSCAKGESAAAQTVQPTKNDRQLMVT